MDLEGQTEDIHNNYLEKWKYMGKSIFISYCCCSKFSGLKQQGFIMLQFWRLEIQDRFHWANIKVSSGLHSLRKALEENPFPFLSQPLEAGRISWLSDPSSVLRASNHITLTLCFCHHISSGSPAFLFHLSRALVILLDPPR